MLLLLAFTFCGITNSVAAVVGVPYRVNIFSAVTGIPQPQRADAARKLYKDNCRKMSEADALHCLSDLQGIARSLNDLSLECAIFDMKADYYSVNHGYNDISTKYYDQAIAFAQKEGLAIEEGLYQHRKAIYYFVYKRNTEACRYFLLSEEKFREIGFENVPEMSNLFSETADFYYSLSDNEDARYNLRYALKYLKPHERNEINILNTIGLTYRNSRYYDVAMDYFKRALTVAEKRDDSVWIAITKGNVGSIYFRNQDYDKAFPLVMLDYRQSLKYNQVSNAAIALLRIIRINIDRNNIPLAALQLDTAGILLKNSKENVLTHMVRYYELRSLLNERLGNSHKAIEFRQTYEHLRDSVARRDNITAIERVKLQWQMDRNRAEIKRLQTIAEADAFKQDTIIVVLLLIMIILGLIYNHQRIKGKKDKELLASEKRRLDQELKNSTLALNGYTENLMQKNILIEQFKTEIDKLQGKFKTSEGGNLMERMTQAHIMTDANWTDFKKLFNKVHGSFLYAIRQKYPHLTPTDIRLVALIKLRLNNREMSGMMGITIDGVKKSKQRLRKKMQIETDTDIEEVISAIN